MEIKNYVKQKESIFGEDDDEILLNPICYINQFETININTNKITNNFTTQKSIEDQNNKNNISINSTLNTNAALDESSQNINNNCSFFSFSQNQHKEHKKELTQQSIEILTEFISKEKEIINTNNINNSLKVLKIKDLKNNCEKLEYSLNMYFKKPFMRKNYEKKNFFKKINDNDDDVDDVEEEEKKLNISSNIDIDDSKKLYKDKLNINNINDINEI